MEFITREQRLHLAAWQAEKDAKLAAMRADLAEQTAKRASKDAAIDVAAQAEALMVAARAAVDGMNINSRDAVAALERTVARLDEETLMVSIVYRAWMEESDMFASDYPDGTGYFMDAYINRLRGAHADYAHRLRVGWASALWQRRHPPRCTFNWCRDARRNAVALAMWTALGGGL